MLAQSNTINRLAESLSVSNVRTKTLVLEILGAICIVPGGHRKVLQAMLHFQRCYKEHARFQVGRWALRFTKSVALGYIRKCVIG